MIIIYLIIIFRFFLDLFIYYDYLGSRYLHKYRVGWQHFTFRAAIFLKGERRNQEFIFIFQLSPIRGFVKGECKKTNTYLGYSSFPLIWSKLKPRFFFLTFTYLFLLGTFHCRSAPCVFPKYNHNRPCSYWFYYLPSLRLNMTQQISRI